MPLTTASPRVHQLRRLHAIGRKHGLGHDELRAIRGVSSLTELTAAQLQSEADRLESAPRRRRPRLCNTPYGAATEGQRAAIWAKLKQCQQECGWSRSKCRRWLQRRYGIETPYAPSLENGQASDILDALDKLLPKERERVASDRG